MQQEIVEPSYGRASFNCPNCFAFTQQKWVQIKGVRSTGSVFIEEGLEHCNKHLGVNGFFINNHVALSYCTSCGKQAYWEEGQLVYPINCISPLPNKDMPEDVRKIYNEAREVSVLSPRAATALLRLALEKLLPQVGATKSSIDKMIGELVGKGLPKEVEKALDSLRVIGNEAVHPGTIDLEDSDRIAHALFKIMNVVVDRMITQPKEIDEIYGLIPENKLEGIEKRNQKVLNGQQL